LVRKGVFSPADHGSDFAFQHQIEIAARASRIFPIGNIARRWSTVSRSLRNSGRGGEGQPIYNNGNHWNTQTEPPWFRVGNLFIVRSHDL